jgi:putative FmdB family regulatory protein
MPIFEYACDDCGTKFEKLVRRNTDAEALECPSCGQQHLTTQYSTFAARAGSSADKECQPTGGCGAGMCQGGMCGMGMN